MLVILSGISIEAPLPTGPTLVILLQPSKASLLILVMPVPMVQLVRLLQATNT